MPIRIAIPSLDNQGLGSLVSEHFGRCPYFTLAEIEDNTIKSIAVIDNPLAHNHAPGQIPAFIHQQGATVILAGGMGHRAVTFFEQYGLEVVTGATGTVGHGVFCELGQGDIDFPAVLAKLRDLNYEGWIVVEQDVLPGMGSPKESARRNRDYLRSIGL